MSRLPNAAPKPKRKPKSPRPPTRKSAPRRTAIKKKPRKPSEYARIYGSKERVKFVKNHACCYCASLHPLFGIQSAGRSHNAHTENEGMGRKGHYTTIIPLCATHHRLYDEYKYPFDRKNQSVRDALAEVAPKIEAAWLRVSGTPEKEQAE